VTRGLHQAFKAGESAPVIELLETANGFWRRARGLLFRRALAPSEGLLIPRCNAVHTFGMCVDIDILFLDSEGRITSISAETGSGVVVLAHRKNVHALEAAAGFVQRHGLSCGDRLTITPEIE
jgi:uncharacterized membrane protein (UPF0127 family)